MTNNSSSSFVIGCFLQKNDEKRTKLIDNLNTFLLIKDSYGDNDYFIFSSFDEFLKHKHKDFYETNWFDHIKDVSELDYDRRWKFLPA